MKKRYFHLRLWIIAFSNRYMSVHGGNVFIEYLQDIVT